MEKFRVRTDSCLFIPQSSTVHILADFGEKPGYCLCQSRSSDFPVCNTRCSDVPVCISRSSDFPVHSLHKVRKMLTSKQDCIVSR